MAEIPWEVKIKKFIKFLEILGLIHKGTKGSHHKYDYPDNTEKLTQPVIYPLHGDTIPKTLIMSNLKTLDISPYEFEKFLKNKKYRPNLKNKYHSTRK